jgi:hypothetical protein
MSRTLCAVVREYFGITDEFIESDAAIAILRGLALHGLDEQPNDPLISQDEDGSYTNLYIWLVAAERFLDLLANRDELLRVADEVVAENEIEVDPYDLQALLTNMSIDAHEYRIAYDRQKSYLHFQID